MAEADAAERLQSGRRLSQAAATLGVELSERQVAQFLLFRDMLLDANTHINLTAITDPDAVLARHFIDSLTCLLACPDLDPQMAYRVLDVGSGAGFPGLVLAIARPNWQIISLEATAKKVRFQEQVIAAAGLHHAQAVQGRAEALAYEAIWRGQFQVVTARALAALPALLEWCQPFAAPGGQVIALKKGDLAAELAQGARAAAILNGAPPEVLDLPSPLLALMPELADGRVLIRVRQRGAVRQRYPRSHAMVGKFPSGISRHP